MNRTRGLILTLLAALVVTPLVLFMLPSPAGAPPSADDFDQSALGRDHGTPLQRAPQDSKRPHRAPAIDTDPVAGKQSRTVPDTDPVPRLPAARLRVIDAATGEPVANTTVRFGLLGWYSDAQAAELARVPFDPDDSDYRAAVTDAAGECELPVTGADVRADDPQPLYPLPPGWLPDTTPAELWPEIVRILEAGGVAEVRIRRGTTLRVVCTHDGAPLPGVRLFAAPLEDTDLPEGMPDAKWDRARSVPDLYVRNGTGEQQSGPGEPEGVTFEDSGYLLVEGEDLVPPEFSAVTDDDGVAILTMPALAYTVTAMAGLLPMKCADVDLAAATEVLFEYEPRARVKWTTVWLGPGETPSFYQFVVLDRMLDIFPEGHERCTVTIKAVRIGVHECVYLVDGEPEFNTWFEILPGDNEITIYLGEAALCEWSAELIVDGTQFDEFKLAYRHADEPAMPFDQWPYVAAFSGHEPARMRPGRYVVHAPDGTTQEVEFPPGGRVHSRFEVSVREVTFTIAEDLWNALTPDRREEGISLGAFYFHELNNSVRELSESMADIAQDGLRPLRPGSPVTLRLPPGVYGIGVELPGPRAGRNFALDLRDPALREVHLTLDGWPGLARYTVTSDGETILAPAGTGAWDSDHSFFDAEASSWTGYFPPGGMLCRAFTDAESWVRAWLPGPGDYRIEKHMLQGECSITVAEASEDYDYAWFASWERNGVEFWIDVQLLSDDEPENAQIVGMPPGIVQVRLQRTARSDRLKTFAMVDLHLSGAHILKLDTVTWTRGGSVKVIEPGPVSEREGFFWWVTGPNFAGIYGRYRHAHGVWFSEHPEVFPGRYYFEIRRPGQIVEVRTVTVRAGQETVVDLR